MRRFLGVLCTGLVFVWAPAALAAPEDGAEERKRLRKELEAERAARRKLEGRVGDLEKALQKTTEALATSQDKRGIEAEIEAYLEAHPLPTGGTAGESRLQIGAVLVGAFRAAFFKDSGQDDNTFRVEERYLRFVYRFTQKVTARYYTDNSLAELEVLVEEWLQFNIGLVVVPFGQFNRRSFADTFDTLSRPLAFLGDADTFVNPANHPRAVFRSLYSDTGVVVSGNRWWGRNQLYYAVWVTNGLTGTNDLGQTASSRDNNRNKQIGARIAFTLGQLTDDSSLGIGISWMTGKFDPTNSLSYRLYGADLIYIWNRIFGEGSSLTIRAEYVFAPREIRYPSSADPDVNVDDAARVQGVYVIVELRFNKQWMVYTELDWLNRKGPIVTNGTLDATNLGDRNTKIKRVSVGVVRRLDAGIVVKLEWAFWDFDLGVSNVHRISTQVVIPF